MLAAGRSLYVNHIGFRGSIGEVVVCVLGINLLRADRGSHSAVGIWSLDDSLHIWTSLRQDHGVLVGSSYLGTGVEEGERRPCQLLFWPLRGEWGGRACKEAQARESWGWGKALWWILPT